MIFPITVFLQKLLKICFKFFQTSREKYVFFMNKLVYVIWSVNQLEKSVYFVPVRNWYENKNQQDKNKLRPQERAKCSILSCSIDVEFKWHKHGNLFKRLVARYKLHASFCLGMEDITSWLIIIFLHLYNTFCLGILKHVVNIVTWTCK